MLAADARHLTVPCAAAIRTVTGRACLEEPGAAIDIRGTAFDFGQLLLRGRNSVDGEGSNERQ